MKLVIEPGTFTIDDKRFFIPIACLEGECPKCKRAVTFDFGDEYLSHPPVGEEFDFTCWCRECSHEWKVPLQLDVTLTMVAKDETIRVPEPIDVVIRNALIARGWTIDEDAKENAGGELHEFVHPETGRRMAWLDAVFAQEKREL
jgi:hypothetical protein